MSMKSTFGKLGAIALLGTIGFMPINNANAQEDYRVLESYTIEINREIATYVKRLGRYYIENIITVKKLDGKIIKYIDDYDFDFKIDRVEVTKDGKTERYGGYGIYTDDIGKGVLKEGQKRFDWYFQKIEEDREKVGSKKAKEILD